LTAALLVLIECLERYKRRAQLQQAYKQRTEASVNVQSLSRNTLLIMILFENSIVKLDYNPATDILVIDYSDLHGYLLPEIKNSVDILTDVAKSYDVKKVLLDSTRTVVSVTPDESREISVYLANALAQTRVQKLARVQSLNAEVETRAKENIEHVQQALTLPFQVRNFSEKAEALEWLQIEPSTI
jgi:hypothetical protein